MSTLDFFSALIQTFYIICSPQDRSCKLEIFKLIFQMELSREINLSGQIHSLGKRLLWDTGIDPVNIKDI